MADPITYSDDFAKMIAELFGKGKTTVGTTGQKTVDQLIKELTKNTTATDSTTNASNSSNTTTDQRSVTDQTTTGTTGQTTTGTTGQTGTSSVTSNADVDPLRQMFGQQSKNSTPEGMANLIQEVFRVGSQQVPGITQAYANATGTRSTDNSGYAMALNELNKTLAGQAATLVGDAEARAANTASSIAAATKGSDTTSATTGTNSSNTSGTNSSNTSGTSSTTGTSNTTGTSTSNTTGTTVAEGSKDTTGSTKENNSSVGTTTAAPGYGATAATLLPELIAALGGKSGAGALGGLAGLGSKGVDLIKGLFGGGDAGGSLPDFTTDPPDLNLPDFTTDPPDLNLPDVDYGEFFADGGMAYRPARGYADGGQVGGTQVGGTEQLLAMLQQALSGQVQPAAETDPATIIGNLQSGMLDNGTGGQTAGNSARSGTPTENAAVVNGFMGTALGMIGGPLGAAAAKGLGLGTMQGVIGTAAVNAAMATMGIGTIGGIVGAVADDSAMATDAMNSADAAASADFGASWGGDYGGGNASASASDFGGTDFGGTMGGGDFGGASDFGGSGSDFGGDGGSSGNGSSGNGSGDAGSSADGSYANGGLVQGPGTGISDSISAQLVDHFGKKKSGIKVSDEEYILSADVTNMLGRDFLDSLQAKFHTPANVQRMQGVR